MNKLIFANLLHRPLRSVISVLAVAIEVIMILSIVGIFMGMLNDQKDRTNGIGADLMLRPSNASIMNGISGAPMPIKDIEVIRKLAARGGGFTGDYAVFDTAADDSALSTASITRLSMPYVLSSFSRAAPSRDRTT